MKNAKKFLLCIGLLLLITNCTEREDFLPELETTDTEIDFRSKEDQSSSRVPNQYIVVLKQEAGAPAEVAAELSRRFEVSVGHVYSHALKGFSARMPEAALNGLLNTPQVDYIEPDLEMYAIAQTLPTGVDRIQAEGITNTDGTKDFKNVDVAIIDTGIDKDHPDLNVYSGRHFYSIIRGIFVVGSGEDDNYDDDNGHGSHVAGTVGALDNEIGVVGVAPGVRLWGVKVLNANGSGYLSDIIKGIDWITRNAAEIEVANMSLGGTGVSSSYRTAIQNSVAAGVAYFVAAGNSDVDVYGSNDGSFGTSDDYIPAAYPEVATISALADSDGQPGGAGQSTSYGPDDSFASFSNFSNQVVASNPVTSPGKAIDLILPGVSIYSTYKDGGYATASGTSMAAPHAAGLAALYIAQNGRADNADGVYVIRQALIDAGVAQNSPEGLATRNDPDGQEENLGWAGALSTGAPVANAGSNQTVSDGDGNGFETVDIDGSASYDPDGSITAYEWYVDGVKLTGYTESILTYDFAVNPDPYTVALVVTDDSDNQATDEVTVTVNPNQAPVADAGGDQTVTDSDDNGSETVSLDGSASYDPDGTIQSYAWDVGNDGTIESTASTLTFDFPTGSSTTVNLTVTDNGGATGSTQVSVTVNAPSEEITVGSISKSSIKAGDPPVDVTIFGTGFAAGATISFENGGGPAPEVESSTVISSTEIAATIFAKDGGPPRARVWDVRVTNPDGSSAVLVGGLTVNP